MSESPLGGPVESGTELPPAPPAYPSGPYGAPVAPAATNGIATAALVLGIVGLVLSFIGWGFFVALVGLVLGIVAVRKAGRVGVGKAKAVWGLVLSILGVIIGALILALVVWAVKTVSNCDQGGSASQTQIQNCVQSSVPGNQ